MSSCFLHSSVCSSDCELGICECLVRLNWMAEMAQVDRRRVSGTFSGTKPSFRIPTHSILIGILNLLQTKRQNDDAIHERMPLVLEDGKRVLYSTAL